MDLGSSLRFALLLFTALLALYLAEARWHLVTRFLREESAALNLAVIRIVILSLLLQEIELKRELVFSGLDPALLYPPPGWGHFAHLIPRSPGLVRAIYALFVVSAVLGIVGLFTRFSCGLVCICAFYLMTLPQLFGKVNHNHHLLAYCFLLAIAPSGDAFSFDEVRRAIQESPQRIIRWAPSRVYASYLQTMMVLVGLIYFFPGAWKLSRAWLQWFSSENMYMLIATKLQDLGGGNRLQKAALSMPHMLVLGACFTLIFELGFTFAVLHKRTRLFAAAAGLLFHRLTGLLMGITFASLQWSYVIFVDWIAVMDWINRRLRIDPVTALYDPQCKLCRRAVSLIVSFDWSARIRVIPNTRLEELGPATQSEVSRLKPDLPFLVIDGEAIAAGYFAYKKIASRVPILWPLRALMSVPAIQSFGLRVYQHIAESRTCSIVSAPGNLETSARRIQTRPAAQVQVLLLAAFFLAGVIHSAGTWPIACFPTFDSPATAIVQKLSMRSLERSGLIKEETLSSDSTMASLFGPERWGGLTNQFMNMPFRPKGAIALLHLWQKNHAYTPVRSAIFSADTYAVNMSSGAQTLIRRRPLGAVSAEEGL